MSKSQENTDEMFNFFKDDIYNLYKAIENADYHACAFLLKNGVNPNSEYKHFPLIYWIFLFM